MTSFKRDQSAQALLELAFLLPMLCVFLLGVVDYSRAIYDTEVITNLAGEGSSLASRGTGSTLANAAAAVMADSDLSMSTNGCVVVTTVTSPAAGTYSVTGQAYSAVCNGGTSKIGCAPPPNTCGTATIPSAVQTMLMNAPSGYTVYITEVFYNFSYATSVGAFLKGNALLPSRLYSVAYY